MDEIRILPAARKYWNDLAARDGAFGATGTLIAALGEFLLDSLPSRLKRRFGDADYDWNCRVNTTSGAVGWRDRLLGTFHSPYQPTEPGLFREMLGRLEQCMNLKLNEFAFIDLGSGKGRALLMASDFPFRRILGVELLPSLHEIAQQNLAQYKGDAQKCFAIESVCADATTFPIPDGPLLLYLFNPFPEAGLRRTLANLETTLHSSPRPAYVLYHNPQLEHVVAECVFLRKIAGTHQYSIFCAQL